MSDEPVLPWDSAPVVRRGTWTYGGVEREVRIVVSPVFHGSGDHEDDPSIAADRDEETFVVLFQTLDSAATRLAGGGQFRTLVEAVQHTEALLATGVRWQDGG